MKKAQLAYRVPLIILILLAIGGCRFNEKTDEDDLALDDVTGGSGTRNEAPSIWGEPESLTLVGGWYSFQPEASDNDGDPLEFSVVNSPDWAQFDPSSGTLQGMPGADDVGMTRNIVISVTDRNSVVSLPSFAIIVRPVQDTGDDDDDEDTTGSSPPVIYGEPNTSAVVGSVYSFQPEAQDEDGDELSFSIVNKPSWASFDTTTGALEGQPGQEDVGTTDLIEVSVSDGSSISALAGFRITVEQAGPLSFTVAWKPPTENEDGTPLTDLAGYRIYYGTSSGKYSEEVQINSPGLTSYVIENLAPGRYFLIMTSVNSRDMESRPTPELEFEVGT